VSNDCNDNVINKPTLLSDLVYIIGSATVTTATVDWTSSYTTCGSMTFELKVSGMLYSSYIELFDPLTPFDATTGIAKIYSEDLLVEDTYTFKLTATVGSVSTFDEFIV
jgi:hypothetical protein